MIFIVPLVINIGKYRLGGSMKEKENNSIIFLFMPGTIDCGTNRFLQ
jgi:hypothetical protein